MKRSNKFIVALIAMLCCLSSYGAKFQVDGISYKTKGKTDALITGTTLTGEVTFPSTVTYDGITYNVTEVSNNAFEGNTGLTKAIFQAPLKKVGDWSFRKSAIQYVDLPKTVQKIGFRAFEDASKMKEIYIRSTTPPGLGISSVFVNTPKDLTFYVPATSKQAYKDNKDYADFDINSITYWKDYVSYVPTSDTEAMVYFVSSAAPSTVNIHAEVDMDGEVHKVTKLDDEAFEYNNGKVSACKIPETIEYVGSKVFTNVRPGTVVTFAGQTAPKFAADAFGGNVPSSLVILVPEQSLEAYKTAIGNSSIKVATPSILEQERLAREAQERAEREAQIAARKAAGVKAKKLIAGAATPKPVDMGLSVK